MLVIPNTVAFLVGVTLVIVVLRLRHKHGESAMGTHSPPHAAIAA